MPKESKTRKLRPIETCPNGHHYNAVTNGDICAVCGAKLDLTAEMTEEELDGFIRLVEQEWTCGWLVCIEGRNKGKAFAIHDGKNYVGSDPNMDICVAGDKRIEKKNHAVILYDHIGKKTILLPGESRGMIYWQGQALYEPKELAPNDRIELGDSWFSFKPFCDADFDWKDNANLLAATSAQNPPAAKETAPEKRGEKAAKQESEQ